MSTLENRNETGGASPPVSIEPAAAHWIAVWDPLVRIFHWSLVAAVLVAWASADELRSLHETAGFVILGLVLVRIVWGFVGTEHARFADFVHRPWAVFRYIGDLVRRRAKRYVGHNPAGGAMIIMLLVMLLATSVLGAAMAAGAIQRNHQVEEIHEVVANLTLILAGVHVVGVLVASLLHRENLIGAMISGRKRAE